MSKTFNSVPEDGYAEIAFEMRANGMKPMSRKEYMAYQKRVKEFFARAEARKAAYEERIAA